MSAPITIRAARREDGARIWHFVNDCDVLETNTCYAYLLLADDFGDTCVVAERDGTFLGFVVGYRPPRRPEAVFVWQVGVSPKARGEGLAGRMLTALVELPGCRTCTHLEATVTPTNEASRRLFQSFARRMEVACEVGPGFASADFVAPGTDGPEHEAEERFRIGPFRR